MTIPSSFIILIVVAFAFYLVYSQQNQSQLTPMMMSQIAGSQMGNPPRLPQQHLPQMPTDSMVTADPRIDPRLDTRLDPRANQGKSPFCKSSSPQVTNIVMDRPEDPYSDAIKRQDLYTMYDPLTYPQLRLPREVLDRYNEYYERTGAYPPFNIATQNYLFDNPVLNGILIKVVDDNEPFTDNTPHSIPLFRIKSAKNANRYFYYVIDQRYLSKIEPKIPLDHVKVNGIRYNNADFYGIPELFDGDMIEHISIYPGAKFKVTLYKTYHFP